ncbi:MAG: hypothetical protein KIS66_14675 [Fimbriimonadaceae bacterium]|nr:hypothetical protein [Fimbriimonadaceae bacterium]
MKPILRTVYAASVALAVAVPLAGCGGKNTAEKIPGASIPITGNTQQQVGNPTATVTGPGTVDVNVGGGSQTATVPNGVTVTAGGPVAFFPMGSVLVRARFAADAPLFLNGVDSGVRLSKDDGHLLQNLVIPVGPAAVMVRFAVLQGGDRNASLGPVGAVVFRGAVFADGTSSVPRTVAGIVPGDGETTQGARITLTFHPLANGKQVTLRVEHRNGSVLKTATIAGGVANLTEITSDAIIEDASLLELSVN